MLPTLMSDILNNGIKNKDFGFIVLRCAEMLAVAAVSLGAIIAGTKLSANVVAAFCADLRADVFRKVNTLSFEEFGSLGTAALVTRATHDVETVSWIASMLAGTVATIPMLFFGGVILSMRKDVMLDGRYLLVMRDALCPELRQALIDATRKRFTGRIFTRGTYAVTDGRHFESPAEIAMLNGHADIVGQSMCPEVYLAREIGACYAGLYFTVNYGEGIKVWSHEDMSNIFYDDAAMIGDILLETIRNVSAEDKQCECLSLRKETLLKDVYNKESDKG